MNERFLRLEKYDVIWPTFCATHSHAQHSIISILDQSICYKGQKKQMWYHEVKRHRS